MKPKNMTVMMVCAILLGLMLVHPTVAQTAQDGRYFPLASPLTIMSPINTTYLSSPQTVCVSFKLIGNPANLTIEYSINGESRSVLSTDSVLQPIEATRTYANGTSVKVISMFSPRVITGRAALLELPEGSYKMVIYSEFRLSSYVVSDEQVVYFTVDDGVAPKFSGLSVENKTYVENSFPLYFELNQHVQWIGYCLDGQENCTIEGNTTLPLDDGSNDLKVYATDNAGNVGATETIYFTITEPLTAQVTITLIIAAVGLGSLAYYKKPKKK